MVSLTHTGCLVQTLLKQISSCHHGMLVDLHIMMRTYE